MVRCAGGLVGPVRSRLRAVSPRATHTGVASARNHGRGALVMRSAVAIWSTRSHLRFFRRNNVKRSCIAVFSDPEVRANREASEIVGALRRELLADNFGWRKLFHAGNY